MLNSSKSKKKMRKIVEFKENGDWIADMYYNMIVGMFFF